MRFNIGDNVIVDNVRMFGGPGFLRKSGTILYIDLAQNAPYLIKMSFTKIGRCDVWFHETELRMADVLAGRRITT